MPIPSTLFNWEPVRECFAEFRAQQDGLDKYIEESFQELDALRTSLEVFQKELVTQRSSLAKEWESFDSAKAAAQSSDSENLELVAKTQQELQQARTELENLRGAEAQVSELQTERDRLHDQIVAAQNEIAAGRAQQAAAADAAAVAAQNRELLEAVTAERDCLREELEKLRNGAALAMESHAARDTEDEGKLQTELFDTKTRLQEVLQQVDEQANYIHELENERGALDSELDTIRGRAADLSDTLVQTKRQIAEERAEWSGEIKQMRQVLEKHSKIINGAPGEAAQGKPGHSIRDTTPTRKEGRQAADAVVGSIVAQFERLRQERAHQRAERQKDLA